MFFNSHLINKTSKIVEDLKRQNLKIAFAESCTGGLLSSLFTEISGSSEVFDRSFITYSNEAKVEMLGVDKRALNQYGAVSLQIAKQMAKGTINNSMADLSISITGIAGPNGGSKEKPVGLVYICLGKRGESGVKTSCRKFNFTGDRSDIRKRVLNEVLNLLITKQIP